MGILPRRPLVGLAIAFVSGTSLGLAYPVSLLALLPATTACLIMPSIPALLNKPPSKLSTFLLLAAIVGLGWANAILTTDTTNRSISSILQLPTGAGITGIVADEPLCVSTHNGKSTWKFPLKVERIRGGRYRDSTEASGTVRMRLFAMEKDRIPAYGERWSFPGYLAQTTFKQGHFAGKPGALYFSGSAHKALFLATGQGSPLIAICFHGRTWAGRILAEGLTDRPVQSCILNSILLGYYSQIPRELYQAFARTGTLHVFAISGSHVVIMGGAIIFILATCGIPRTHWVLILGPLLIFYTAMTGLEPSAMRACIMGIVYWIAPLIGRKPDIFTTLAASAILILGVAPNDLTNVGFILSYVAVLGLVLFCPVFMTPLHRCFRHDPLKLESDPRWVEGLRSLWIMFSDLLSVSLAAWLATTPLSILYFGNFSPIGLPSNLLIVPLSSLVIITGVVSLTLGSCWLWLADLFNHANLALIVLMTEAARWFSALPHGCITVPPVSLWGILVFYAMLLITRFMIWVYAKEKMEVQIGSEE